MSSQIVDRLIKSNFDLKDWLLTETPRLLGVLAFIRDDFYKKLTKDQIILEIEKCFDDSISHYKSKIEGFQNYIDLKDDPDTIAKEVQEFELKRIQVKQDYEKDLTEFSKNKSETNESIIKLTRLIEKNTNPNISDALEASLKYLTDVYKFDYSREFYKPSILRESYEEYKKDKLAECEKNIQWDKKELEKIEQRKKEHLDFYLVYSEFIEANIDAI